MQEYQVEQRLPPHNADIEMSLIGGLLVAPEEVIHIRDIVESRDFYQVKAARAYSAIVGMNERAMPADVLSVAEAMKGDTDENAMWLLSAFNEAPLNRSTDAHARIIADKAVRRRMIASAGRIADAAFDEDKAVKETLPAVEAELLDIRGQQNRRDILKPAVYASSYIDKFNELRMNGEQQSGISTGLIDVDRMIGGLEAPHQYILAARPKMGKSSLMLTIVANAIFKQRLKVALFTLEMSARQVMDRLVSMATGIPLNIPGEPCVKRPWLLSDEQTARVYEATGKVADAALFIDDTAGITPSEIRVKCLRLYAEHGLDLVVVDHLHIMRPDTRLNRSDQEYGEMTTSLAALYKELNVPGITVAQLNRSLEQRQNKRPLLSDLRESGRIEENAYAVMFLYRAGYYDELEEQGTAELILAANRDGATGTAKLFWKAEQTRFCNFASREIAL